MWPQLTCTLTIKRKGEVRKEPEPLRRGVRVANFSQRPYAPSPDDICRLDNTAPLDLESIINRTCSMVTLLLHVNVLLGVLQYQLSILGDRTVERYLFDTPKRSVTNLGNEVTFKLLITKGFRPLLYLHILQQPRCYRPLDTYFAQQLDRDVAILQVASCPRSTNLESPCHLMS